MYLGFSIAGSVQLAIENWQSAIPLYFPSMQSLQASIERLFSLKEVERDSEARKVFLEFRHALTQGKIRAAEKPAQRGTGTAGGRQGIRRGFRLAEPSGTGNGGGRAFVDKS